jgi:hypothetical protein
MTPRAKRANPMSAWKVSISYRSAKIIAELLPPKHLSQEALQAQIEFLGEIMRTQKQIDIEDAKAEEKDPDT